MVKFEKRPDKRSPRGAMVPIDVSDVAEQLTGLSQILGRDYQYDVCSPRLTSGSIGLTGGSVGCPYSSCW